MLMIEISYTTEEDEYPEHYGYYDNIEDAKKKSIRRLERN